MQKNIVEFKKQIKGQGILANAISASNLKVKVVKNGIISKSRQIAFIDGKTKRSRI